ncbi:beta-D-glucosyl crocetin beta-1,6-glucosyltransferase-like [Olea europaea subsp. europaea]|uniref:Glycosyltransferase n=1 Tax=Olea europaea subsp. europaea TaxID=158383 RepID=A0A8S0URZ3_OLEEU|nr:beta-D-glucosyl crocetin beta-1,6-glucosyltransferase-like [Olea europaea subsp. europaea]
METQQTSLIRILMFPWLAHGHIFPYFELAKKLSQKNFQIYFCSTSINLTSISKSIENNSCDFSVQLVELHLPSWPELPPHYHTTKNVPSDLMPKLHEAFQLSRSSFAEIIKTVKPDLVIYDFFQPWAATLASSLGIPAVYFASSGAATMSFYYHYRTYGNATFPYQTIYLHNYERINLEVLHKIEEAGEDFPFGSFKRSCEIVLIKSCWGIEGKYLDLLSVFCQRKMVSVGPLVTQTDSEEDYSEIMQWLSKKNQFSTVFISLGSENYLSREQMEEMAQGLELCDVNFIWVIRFPGGEATGLKEALPEGFLERVQGKGVIVQGWAPQAKILAHPSTGGFLSHCGWSSIMESIYFGVPVIAIPLKYDQPLNSRLLVEAGVCVEVPRDDIGQFNREGVANSIHKVIVEKTGEGMRSKANELRNKMKEEEAAALNETSEQLFQLCVKFKQKL